MAKDNYIGVPRFVKRDLPEGFTQIEYIKPSGSEYLDTGIAGSETIKVEAGFIPSDTTTDQIMFGVRWGYADFSAGFYQSNFRGHARGSWFDIDPSTLGEEINIIATQDNFNVNGVDYSITGTQEITTNTLYIFNAPIISGTVSKGLSPCTYFKVYSDDVLVRDYIPCINSSGVVGMYDLVNSTFNIDAAGGTFTAGPSEFSRSLTNLLPTPSEWTLSDVTILTFEGYGETFSFNTGVTAMASCSLSTPEVGHLYYGRCVYMTDAGTAFSCGDGRFEYYYSDSTNGLMVFQTAVENDTAGTVITESKILSITEDISNGANWQFRNFIVNGTQRAYRAMPLLIDLSQAFGVGNEPTKEWCDKNIPYFLGTQEFTFSDLKSIGLARKNLKGYIGIGSVIVRDLPTDYSQVEYIESSGTQYIDTDFIPTTENIKVMLNFEYTADYSTHSLFGSQVGVNQQSMIIAYGNPSFYVGTSTGILSQSTSLNTKYNLICHANNGLLTVELNGNITSENYTGTLYKDGTLYLFGNNVGGSVEQMVSAKVYSCKIYDNEILVRDYVPCINSSNVPGLYDLVNDAFYSNAGSGTFSIGSICGGVARKIKKGYFGVNGVARQFWSADS